MKFATLALALLLAVGSRAAPMQADAPQMLAHARSVADMYMTNLKTSLRNAVLQMEDSPMKDKVLEHLESMFQRVTTARETLAPMTDTVVSTIMETTSDFRSIIRADIEALKKDIGPMEENLRTVVQKHLDEYKAIISPIVEEYQVRHNAEMDALRAKMEPAIQQMQEKVAVNVEETKSALIPIIEAVREKVQAWVSNARSMAEPYAAEYKEQVKQLLESLRSIDPQELADLKQRLQPMAMETNEKVQAMFEEISKVLMRA